MQSMFGTITQRIINQNFQLFVGPILVTWCNFYFFFSFNSRYPNSPNPVKKKKNQKPEPSERRRGKKKTSQRRLVKEEGKKKKKKERTKQRPKILCDE